MSEAQHAEVLFAKRGAVGLITLNRPKALNALTRDMCLAMYAQLGAWQDDPEIKAVAIRGEGDRAFCAGGDIRALYEAGRSDRSLARAFYRDEYRLNARIKHFPKPYIAFVHGIVMGGGVGVSVHGRHRVANSSAVFAMPETGIGLFPDVGGSFFLPRLPGEAGMYLAMTGARLNAADIWHLGIATHAVERAEWEHLIGRLSNGKSTRSVLARCCGEPGSPPLEGHRSTIDSAFAEQSIEGILAALDRRQDEWSRSKVAAIRAKSPSSLKISHRQLRNGRSLDFDDCMRMEFRMVNRVIAGHDFYEGVRATIIEKDGAPHWHPSTLGEVSGADVDSYFAPLKDGELDL